MVDKNQWKLAHRIGIFFVLAFVPCFLWVFVRGVEAELHMSLFKLSFVGFSGMNIGSFIAGAVQVYIWAYVYIVLWGLAGQLSRKGK